MTFPGKHLPLIKFLGPRSLLQHSRPSAPHASHQQPPRPTQAAEPKRSGNTVSYESAALLPRRYQRKPISQAEIDAVETGGADHVLTY
ncbi:hypothetical protein BDZ88DRAFT_452593 [Geranomyces variabilis]|nr:hypothetical protein BDZ88DRAFT_452593 [Geranomyces variabilis]KAJ3135120.1 hypothetical protein HDU90_004152 [Geranomyces variabilis]